jgi:hypothetical protein
MTFEEKLANEAVSEWALKYLNYKRLKHLIQMLPKQGKRTLLPSGSKDDSFYIPKAIDYHLLSKEEQELLSILADELKKIETFFFQLLKENVAKKELLMDQLERLTILKKERNRTTKRQLSSSGSNSNVISAEATSSKKKTRALSLVESSVDSSDVEEENEEAESRKNNNQGIPVIDPLLQSINQVVESSSNEFNDFLLKQHYSQASQHLKKALTELYRSTELLKSYHDLNSLAYQRIIKKYEKKTRHFLKDLLLKQFFSTSFSSKGATDLAALLSSLESLYTRYFTSDNNHLTAMKELRQFTGPIINDFNLLINYKERSYRNLMVGFLQGINVMLCVYLYQIAHSQSQISDEGAAEDNQELLVVKNQNLFNRMIIICFGLFFPIFIANLIILNMIIWDYFKINYRLIFSIHPRTSTSKYSIFVSFLGTFFLSYVTLSLLGKLDSFFYPLTQIWILILCLFLFVVNSLTRYRASRIWFVVLIWRIITSPTFPCIFKDFFVADQLVSMIPLYQSIGLILKLSFASFSSSANTLTASGPSLPTSWWIILLPLIPFYWRAVQCLRRYYDATQAKAIKTNTQLFNCSRYSLGMLFMMMSGGQSYYKHSHPSLSTKFMWAEIVFRILYSIFSFYWDVVMDWGLGNGRFLPLSESKTSNKEKSQRSQRSQRSYQEDARSISRDEEEGEQFDIEEEETEETKAEKDEDETKTKGMIVYPPWLYYIVILTDGCGRFIWLPFTILSSFYGVNLPNASNALAIVEILRRFQWNFLRVEIEHIHNCGKYQATEEITLPFNSQDLFLLTSTDTFASSHGSTTGRRRKSSDSFFAVLPATGKAKQKTVDQIEKEKDYRWSSEIPSVIASYVTKKITEFIQSSNDSKVYPSFGITLIPNELEYYSCLKNKEISNNQVSIALTFVTELIVFLIFACFSTCSFLQPTRSFLNGL